MSITTISSLSESFISVAPTSHEEVATEKEVVHAVVIPKEEALRVEESKGEVKVGARGDAVTSLEDKPMASNDGDEGLKVST